MALPPGADIGPGERLGEAGIAGVGLLLREGEDTIVIAGDQRRPRLADRIGDQWRRGLLPLRLVAASKTM